MREIRQYKFFRGRNVLCFKFIFYVLKKEERWRKKGELAKVIGCLQTIFTSIFFGNTLYIHGTIEIVK
jgi:hypothetical protein